MQFWDIVKLIGEMKKVGRATPEELAALQEQKLRRMLTWAKESSPYYARQYRGIDVTRAPLTELPTTNKAGIMDNFHEVVTDPVLKLDELRAFLEVEDNSGKRFRERFIPFKSSGTSGYMSVVVYEQDGINSFYAALAARQQLSRKPTGGQQLRMMYRNIVRRKKTRLAFIMVRGAGGFNIARHVPQFQSFFMDHCILPTSDSISTIVAKLNAFQPDSLVCYPSYLDILAHEKLEGRLHIKLDLPVSAITTGGEPLLPSTRALAKRAWDLEVEDLYGMTECLSVARNCGQFDGMHIMSDLAHVEVVDAQHRPVRPGELGSKLLVTNLINRVQPLIRYEINDVTGINMEPCACGSPFPRLLPIHGRSVDQFFADHDNGARELISAYRFGFLYLLEGVKQWQLVQTARNELTFNFVPATGSTASTGTLRPLFDREMAQAGLKGVMAVKFNPIGHIPHDPRTGKFRQMMNLMSPTASDAAQPAPSL